LYPEWYLAVFFLNMPKHWTL